MKLITIKELSDFLKVKESTLYSWVHYDTIPFYKLNGHLIVKRAIEQAKGKRYNPSKRETSLSQGLRKED
ncbi:MAG: helix-turn-helix domain-containing protein [Deltaproteobacteria bacterium]|nr:helix-turn-helix domain-containing protein [Deltaproteobacteria bacterium]